MAFDRLSLFRGSSQLGCVDHFIYYKKSGGDLHGDISVDTIIYLEGQKEGGLLQLDPPIRMSRGFKFSSQSNHHCRRY
jgi:hypothetical protein